MSGEIQTIQDIILKVDSWDLSGSVAKCAVSSSSPLSLSCLVVSLVWC